MAEPTTSLSPTPTAPIEPLALRGPEAAVALGVGLTMLRELTLRGEVPCVRMGRAVVYPVEALRAYLRERIEKGGRR